MIKGFLANISYLAGAISVGDNVYLTDVLDIAIIAALIYLLIYFLKQTRSLFAFIGVSMLVALYALANLFGLFLTSIALQAFFGAFFIILAIIFQEELRRFFELLAYIGTRQIQTRSNPSTSSIYSLTQALASLAHKKHGALIVIPGQEGLDRHLKGGEALDGIISESLIESIFNPKNPGHDGAVVINQNRVVRFGVQLPLSKNFPEMKGRGTRHSAALGLSEITDAMVIVLSEEKGTISVAKNGKLRSLSDPGELENIIKKFIKDKFPEGVQSSWNKLLKKNTLAKIASLAIAVLIWTFSVFQAEIVRKDFTIPITYSNVPENVIIENSNPKEVTLTIAARENTGINSLSKESMIISIDGSKLEEGLNIIEIKESLVEKPFYVSIIEIFPQTVNITTKTYNKVSLPIEVETVGQLSEEFTIERITVSPPVIDIFLPAGQKIPSVLKTEPLDLSEITKNTVMNLKLQLPDGARLQRPADGEPSVSIRINQK